MRQQTTRSLLVVSVVLLCAMPILSCSGKRPSNVGTASAGLAPCPSSPNCVSSEAPDAPHRVEAFTLSVPPEVAWRVIRKEVARMPRTTIVEATADRLHAESRSSLFGFVDDLELRLRAADGVVAVRSASRVGHSDLGVNRRRVERLREALRGRGVVR